MPIDVVQWRVRIGLFHSEGAYREMKRRCGRKHQKIKIRSLVGDASFVVAVALLAIELIRAMVLHSITVLSRLQWKDVTECFHTTMNSLYSQWQQRDDKPSVSRKSTCRSMPRLITDLPALTAVCIVVLHSVVRMLLLMSGDIERNPGPQIILSVEDLSTFANILGDAAPKWMTIGDQLGFKYSEMKSIQSIPQCASGGDQVCFQELLAQWLKWAPPKHELPTLEKLASAVREAEEERLAYDLTQIYMDKEERDELTGALVQSEAQVNLERKRVEELQFEIEKVQKERENAEKVDLLAKQLHSERAALEQSEAQVNLERKRVEELQFEMEKVQKENAEKVDLLTKQLHSERAALEQSEAQVNLERKRAEELQFELEKERDLQIKQLHSVRDGVTAFLEPREAQMERERKGDKMPVHDTSSENDVVPDGAAHAPQQKRKGDLAFQLPSRTATNPAPCGYEIQSDPKLKRLLKKGRPTGIILGGGSFGRVEEVKIDGDSKVYAAKRYREEGMESPQKFCSQFCNEFLILCELSHPHIVKYHGMCPSADRNYKLPLFIMERMAENLHTFLLHKSNLPHSQKICILHDVADGLLYLHSRKTAVIHRDLTAKNVLLDSSGTVAKIADFGNSRLIDLEPGCSMDSMTAVPGTLVYMAPEALSKKYDMKVDVFSFGHLALFTIIQEFPSCLDTHTFTDDKGVFRARTEIERRTTYFTKLYLKVPAENPIAVLIRKSLQNNPASRPSSNELLQQLNKIKNTLKPDENTTDSATSSESVDIN